jgi:FixJ family two-component response regulator
VPKERNLLLKSPLAAESSKADGFTVFLVDDDQSALDSLSELLHEAGFSTKPYIRPENFLEDHDEYVHGCAVLDLWMPRLSGLDVQRELLKRGVERPVIFLTGAGDVPTSVEAMKGGAVDYFQKPFKADEFLDAIRLAEQRDRVRLQKYREREAIRTRIATLTRRERAIVDLVVGGMQNKEIAARLGVTLRTTKEYRGRAMRKMYVKNVPELVRAMRERPSIDGEE